MADGCYEADGGWREGVLRRDRDGKEPAAVCEVLANECGLYVVVYRVETVWVE